MHFFVPKPMHKDLLYAVLHLKTRAWDVASNNPHSAADAAKALGEEGEDLRHVLAALKKGRASDGAHAYRQREVRAALTRQVVVRHMNNTDIHPYTRIHTHIISTHPITHTRTHIISTHSCGHHMLSTYPTNTPS